MNACVSAGSLLTLRRCLGDPCSIDGVAEAWRRGRAPGGQWAGVGVPTGAEGARSFLVKDQFKVASRRLYGFF